jgi:hypothetical protein
MELVEPVLHITTDDGKIYFKMLPKTDRVHLNNSVFVTLSVAKKEDFISVTGNKLIRYKDIKTVEIKVSGEVV